MNSKPRDDDLDNSILNSMDCWDYTIELECLTGPQGILLFFFFFIT